MAISISKALQRCETYPATGDDPTTNKGNPSLMVVMTITFDDTEDAELPAISNHVTHLNRFDAEGEPTVISGQIQLVQDICAAVWV